MPRDENDARNVKDSCDKCDYVPKNYTDFLAHLKKKHPEDGDTRTGS